MPVEVRYVADTSVFINSWTLLYPMRRFAPFWDRLDGLISDGALRSPREVLEEIKRKDDALHDWMKSRREVFVPIDEDQQHHVSRIVNHYHGMLATGHNAADPWVVALAKSLSATVVTEEKPASLSKGKMPDVCAAEDVACLNVLGMIDAEDWSF